METEIDPTAVDEYDTTLLKVRSFESFENAIGLNSVAVFTAGEHVNGDMLYQNLVSHQICLVDPWPEYHSVGVKDGTVVFEDMWIKAGQIEDMFDKYGEAVIIPLAESLWEGRK